MPASGKGIGMNICDIEIKGSEAIIAVASL